MSALVLVGLMGSGKSTVGALLAERLGRTLIDTDRLIEQATGSTVRELWEAGGEAAYRQQEFDLVLDHLDDDPPPVIAAPGGAVLSAEVCAALGDAFVVRLVAPPELLAERVQTGDHRPLLGADPLAVLRTQAVEREEHYRSVTDLEVPIAGRTPEEIADLVLGHCGSELAR